jgi:ADP-ribosylglycohydrolase
VPQSIIAFLESNNYEDAIRKAVSMGGDSDTLGCMTGGIAQAYYEHIPEYIVGKVRGLLNEDFLDVLDEFNQVFDL